MFPSRFCSLILGRMCKNRAPRFHENRCGRFSPEKRLPSRFSGRFSITPDSCACQSVCTTLRPRGPEIVRTKNFKSPPNMLTMTLKCFPPCSRHSTPWRSLPAQNLRLRLRRRQSALTKLRRWIQISLRLRKGHVHPLGKQSPKPRPATTQKNVSS